MRTEMKVYFLHKPIQDTMIILEEVNLLPTWCPQCDMMVLWKALNVRHTTTAQCAKGVERKRCNLAEAEMWGKVLPGLRQATRDCHIFQILGAGLDGFR